MDTIGKVSMDSGELVKAIISRTVSNLAEGIINLQFKHSKEIQRLNAEHFEAIATYKWELEKAEEREYFLNGEIEKLKQEVKKLVEKLGA
ncbi:MAG: hypothetical protein GX585_05985 [Clostridiales bacterium]|nr:hypothetical protein [Clostridiales bacterium]